MTVGILALQGAFQEHLALLNAHGITAFLIRNKKDLQRPFDGLILPGGESTTMGKLLKELDLFDLLQQKMKGGLPVLGTCAGLILLANRLEDGEIPHLKAMDIAARRNGYGRQLGSFTATAAFETTPKIPMVFIRAPYITAVGNKVTVLATVNGKIVAAKEKNILVTAFHPELTENFTVHRYFLEMVKVAQGA